jgi:hypothetical protein
VFCISISFFFLTFSISWVTPSLILSIFSLNSFLYLWCSLFHFGVYLGLLWYYLFVVVFSHIIFFVFNFLSDSCMFWLTMSSNISMKFSLITCRISSFSVLVGFLWFLGTVYLCFVGVWMLVPILLISLWILY